MNELPYVTDSTYLDMSVCFAEERKGKERKREVRPDCVAFSLRVMEVLTNGSDDLFGWKPKEMADMALSLFMFYRISISG
ncbi:hypothetical protein AXG93_1617s1200 [Marchantia polymorpha subsp. ruderalis]|uniref:Uncharacterized protein n=1 Tax=Marchantia polymorpha subsp. ruderalis TaxID=1480154 RepID=A0A176W8K0_MARPO|nr:hypothetical protein AXG93_1617s1200 [Marchantia polymorpha subsp. ruderalis]